MMKTYWLSLRNHQGVQVVFLMHTLGFVAGLMREGGDKLFYATLGAAAMSVFWLPVLWTAWTGRKQYQQADGL